MRGAKLKGYKKGDKVKVLRWSKAQERQREVGSVPDSTLLHGIMEEDYEEDLAGKALTVVSVITNERPEFNVLRLNGWWVPAYAVKPLRKNEARK